MNFPSILKRLFFPKRQPEDRPEPGRHKGTRSTEPAGGTEEVLERAAANQEDGAAQAAEPAKDGRVSVERAADKRNTPSS